MKPSSLAPFIDSTLLDPNANEAAILELCRQAEQHRFAAVCVQKEWVATCRDALSGKVAIASVVGFPDGCCATALKVADAIESVQAGATEIDMVVDIAALVRQDYQRVLEDIAGVVRAAAPAIVKVILEMGLLGHDAKVSGCALASAAGAAFVKTSTGLVTPGASVGDVALMRAVVGANMGIKAAGGIRTREAGRAMIAAGANRIGTSVALTLIAGEAECNV